MQQLRNFEERDNLLDKSIKELGQVNKKVAKFLERKEELTYLIIDVLGHEKEGQHTYEHRSWKLEVKTPFIYSLNKNAYESGNYSLPKEFNPIKKSVSYRIDKRLCDEALEKAPDEVRELLVELIDKKPGKASVSIKERV